MTISTPKIAVAGLYRNVLTETDKNKFILDSENNTFKILIERNVTVTLATSTDNQDFYFPHGLKFAPQVTAFAKETTEAQVFSPNSDNVYLWGAKLGWTSTGVRFNSVSADSERVICNFNNTDASTVTVDIKYYCFEAS